MSTARTDLMQIGELAERTGLSLRTIRHYDDEGLLTPTTRSSGGFRLYSADDHHRLMVIKRMKPLGFSIDQMRDLLDVIHQLQRGGRENPELLDRLQNLLVEARERRDEPRTQLMMAEEFILSSSRSNSDRSRRAPRGTRVAHRQISHPVHTFTNDRFLAIGTEL